MHLDSYRDAGLLVALALINRLAPAGGRGAERDAMAALRGILEFDPPSLALLRERDAPGFMELARRLRELIERLRAGAVDDAAADVNALLSQYPAHPHLAKEAGVWRLHHHPADAKLVPMYGSICAEALARMIDAGAANRFGVCEDEACSRAFFDTSKNASRRFCSTTCQNRIKTAAFRQRRAEEAQRTVRASRRARG